MKMLVQLKIYLLAYLLSSLTWCAYAEEEKVVPETKTETKIGNIVKNKDDKEVTDIPLKELRMFAEVFGHVKQEFVEPVSDQELIRHAIRGMIAGLDPHSSFLTSEEYKDLKIGTSGEFGGLGIEIGMEDGFIKVISPIDDTPAQRAGIKAGDLIIKLNEISVKGMSLDESVNLMRGAPGSKVTLTIVRSDEDKPLVITLERAIIHVTSVKSKILEPGFAYIRISQFQLHTNDDLIKKLELLKQEAKGNIKGLILDLRNNPGGVLNAAVNVSDTFLEAGLIVYTEGRDPKSRLDYAAGPNDILNNTPMVVLINSGSASAAEIVAGALQDHKRALIVGGQSFGKGSVQSVIQIDQDSALKLTTARYYTPLGRSIQAEGITPDIMLNQVKVKVGDETSVKPIKEADLNRHLTGNEKANKTFNETANDNEQLPATQDKNTSNQSLIEQDFQLNEALNVLKGLSLMRPIALQKSNLTK